MRKIAALVLVFTSVISLSAMELDKSSAFDFLTIQLDARSIGIGGGSSLIPGHGASHWGNPALLSAYEKVSFAGSFSPYVADINLGGVTGSYRFKNGIMLAPSFRYVSVGDIDAYDEKGDPLDANISPFGIDGGVAVSYQWIPGFSTGLTTRFAYEHLTPEIVGLTSDVNASALLFDGGIFFTPSRAVSLSAGFRNAGFFLKRYEDDSSSLPASIYSGFRYYSRGNLQVNMQMEAEKRIDLPLSFAPGMEFLIYKEIVALRIGTNFSTDDMSHFWDVLRGKAEQKHEYSKSDAQVIALGGGIKVPLQEKAVFFDFATKILADGMGAALFFTGGFSF